MKEGDQVNGIAIAMGSGGLFETNGGAIFSGGGFSAYAIANFLGDASDDNQIECSIYEADVLTGC